MREVILPSLPPLTPSSKKKLIMIADTYAKGHRENILHYLETGEVMLEELPLLDNVPEIKEWLVREFNAWRYPADPVEESARAALQAILPARPEDVASLPSGELETLEAALHSYINDYGVMLPSGNIVPVAKDYLDAIDRIRAREVEKREWEQVDVLSYRDLMDYLRRHPGTPFFSELDNHLWDIVKGEPVDINLIRQFLKDMPRSSHFAEAAAIDREFGDWELVRENRNLKDVFNYLNTHPFGVFAEESRHMIEELKRDELDKIKQSLGKYTINDYREWTKAGGIFTEQDFFDAGIVTKESLAALKVPDSERDLNTSRTNYDCPTGCTDVYFLGIPSTGKTCILMGMLNTVGHLDWDSVRFGGEYGCALQKLCDLGTTPLRTRGNFATLFTGTIKDYENDGVVHPVNLIEMAGEAFAEKIARNPDANVTIRDLGDGIPQMLSNDNEKVFFIVIDPTEDVAKYRTYKEINGKTELVEVQVPQKQTINKFCSILQAPENEAIMRKVRGLYFIATKADCLGPREVRDEKAKETIQSRYGQSVLKLEELCHPDKYDLNALTENEMRVFPFSLGSFYLGNMFQYDPTDSEKIIRLVSMLATGESGRIGIWKRIQRWFNER